MWTRTTSTASGGPATPNSQRFWPTAVVLLAGLAVLVSLAVVDGRRIVRQPPAGASPAPSTATTVSVNAVAADPGRYVGGRVTLRALVEARLGSGALVITERYVPDQHDLLVVGAAPMVVPTAARPGESVEVRGTVRRLERRHWALAGDAPEATLEAWTGRAVVIAEAVVPSR